MLAVYRHDLRARLRRRAHQKIAARDEAFLIGERRPLFCADRKEGRFQPRKTRDRHKHDVGIGIGARLFKRLFAPFKADARGNIRPLSFCP